MLGYSTVITFCGMGNLVLNTWITQNAYIKHSGLPGGPLLYIASNYNTPAVAVALACQLVVDILTSAVQVHIYLPPIYPMAEFRARFGVYGSSGVLLDMPIWSPYCLRCASCPSQASELRQSPAFMS
jgi:hypothetical protein